MWLLYCSEMLYCVYTVISVHRGSSVSTNPGRDCPPTHEVPNNQIVIRRDRLGFLALLWGSAGRLERYHIISNPQLADPHLSLLCQLEIMLFWEMSGSKKAIELYAWRFIQSRKKNREIIPIQMCFLWSCLLSNPSSMGKNNGEGNTLQYLLSYIISERKILDILHSLNLGTTKRSITFSLVALCMWLIQKKGDIWFISKSLTFLPCFR